jgi:hypothetical protein
MAGADADGDGWLATGLAVLSTVLVVAPLVAIFVYLIYKGASSLSFASLRRFRSREGERAAGWRTRLWARLCCWGLPA